MDKILKPLIIILVVLAVFSGIFFLVRSKTKKSSSELLLNQIQSVSLIKSNLVDVRVNIVNLTKLDPNKLDFQEKRTLLLNHIKMSNKELKVSLEAYEKSQKDIKIFSLKKLQSISLRKKYDLKKSLENIANVSTQIDTFTADFENVGQATAAIYSIYFPSDYEKYNVDLSAYYEGELQNKLIFTDVKERVINVDQNKFNTSELTHRLDELQIIFNDCLEKIGKESVAFSDLAECEDALSMGELKDLAYFVELTYINKDSFLKIMADMTNDAYALQAATSGMAESYENSLD